MHEKSYCLHGYEIIQAVLYNAYIMTRDKDIKQWKPSLVWPD